MRGLLQMSAVAAALLACGQAVGGDAATGPIGKKIDTLSLPDIHGREHELAEFADAKLLVVAFLGTECPLAKQYAPRWPSCPPSTTPRG